LNVSGIPGQPEERFLQYFHDEVAINWLISLFLLLFFIFNLIFEI